MGFRLEHEEEYSGDSFETVTIDTAIEGALQGILDGHDRDAFIRLVSLANATGGGAGSGGLGPPAPPAAVRAARWSAVARRQAFRRLAARRSPGRLDQDRHGGRRRRAAVRRTHAAAGARLVNRCFRPQRASHDHQRRRQAAPAGAGAGCTERHAALVSRRLAHRQAGEGTASPPACGRGRRPIRSGGTGSTQTRCGTRRLSSCCSRRRTRASRPARSSSASGGSAARRLRGPPWRARSVSPCAAV